MQTTIGRTRRHGALWTRRALMAAATATTISSRMTKAQAADGFSFGLAAGQTIAASFSPRIDGVSHGITLRVELTDAAGNLLASAAAPAMYEDVILPAFAVPSAGNYTITVHGLPGQIGRFRGLVVVDTPAAG